VIIAELSWLLLHGSNGLGIVARILVIIAEVGIAIPVVGVIIPKGISKREIAPVPEMISVPEVVFVPPKVPSLALCEAMADETVPRKAMPGKPTEVAAATASSTMAGASPTMCERGGGREGQNADQTYSDKLTLNGSH